MAQKRKHANNIGQLPLLSRAPAPTQGQLSVRRDESRSFEDDVRVARVTESRRKSMSGGSEASSEHSVKQRKKAEPVKSACVQCQKRKTKCSGERPICRFCSDRDLTCSWDISDGMTRTADLKQKLVDANGRGDALKQQLLDEGVISDELRTRLGSATDRGDDLDAVMEVLRSGTDQASTMMLARLRMGASIDDLVASLRTGAAASASSPASSRSAREESRSHSNSPAMSPLATSSQTFVPHRKDSHRTSEAWQRSPVEYQAPSRYTPTTFGADGSQYAQSRHGSTASTFDTTNNPVTHPFLANDPSIWKSNSNPSAFSTPQYNTAANQPQHNSVPVLTNPSVPRATLPIRLSPKAFKFGA